MGRMEDDGIILKPYIRRAVNEVAPVARALINRNRWVR